MRAAVLFLSLGAIVFAAAPARLAAQATPENAIYVELLGSGGLYSLNYERRIGTARARVGFSNWTVDDLFGAGKDRYTVLPLTVSHVAGSGNHHLESGGGVTIGHTAFSSSFDGSRTSSGFVSLTGLLGYRYQKPASGFIFRAVLTPFYGFGREQVAYPDQGFFPSFGISFGSAF